MCSVSVKLKVKYNMNRIYQIIKCMHCKEKNKRKKDINYSIILGYLIMENLMHGLAIIFMGIYGEYNVGKLDKNFIDRVI